MRHWWNWQTLLFFIGLLSASIGVAFFALRQTNSIPPLEMILPQRESPPPSIQTPAEHQALYDQHGLHTITLPPGFQLSVYAQIPNARSLTVSPAGTVFVGTRQRSVYAVRDNNGDGFGDQVFTIATNLNSPNGVAFKDGDLYVATIHQILRFPKIEDTLENPPSPEVVYDQYPRDAHHGWKFIAFGPDGKLYVPVGAPCNVCERDNPVYASLTALDLETKKMTLLAEGVRNSVGFDWHPLTGELWFTDNGRDQMGDNLPVDELNVLKNPGSHFGFPFCHQGDVQDPQFTVRSCAEFVPPVLKLSPHGAALGMRFYDGTAFPSEYRGDIFIAEHGSWNRTEPIGYRVMRVRFDETGGLPVYEPFAQGWLQPDGTVIGRPVDVQELGDGSILISDDQAGLVYRITYTAE